MNKYFAPDAHIYLDSCSTGLKIDNKMNIADHIAKNLTYATVSAPVVKHTDSYLKGLELNGLISLMNDKQNVRYVVRAKNL